MVKKVLILGGTGAMGKALVELLDKKEYEIYITSRKKRDSNEVQYLHGNAHDLTFLNSILNLQKWDSIIDFMVYNLSEFKHIVNLILPKTKQYIFVSSARVYAPTKEKISEDFPRLLDVCQDIEYLSTNEYALEKAREENVLLHAAYSNWTIVRPSLTYNDNRLQFALWDKEGWLYRALNGKSIIFPKNMSEIKTTMSYGYDVSFAMSKLICNESAIGEIVNIAGAKAVTWSEILKIYRRVIKQETGKDIKVQYIDDWEKLTRQNNSFYQAKYARTTSREFSSKKLTELVGKIVFISPEDGLTMCVQKFVADGCAFNEISCISEGLQDRITGEGSVKEFHGWKQKIGYIVAKKFPCFLNIIRR